MTFLRLPLFGFSGKPQGTLKPARTLTHDAQSFEQRIDQRSRLLLACVLLCFLVGFCLCCGCFFGGGEGWGGEKQLFCFQDQGLDSIQRLNVWIHMASFNSDIYHSGGHKFPFKGRPQGFPPSTMRVHFAPVVDGLSTTTHGVSSSPTGAG